MTVGLVGEDIIDYISYLFLKPIDKFCGVIFVMLDVTELLLPYTS